MAKRATPEREEKFAVAMSTSWRIGSHWFLPYTHVEQFADVLAAQPLVKRFPKHRHVTISGGGISMTMRHAPAVLTGLISLVDVMPLFHLIFGADFDPAADVTHMCPLVEAQWAGLLLPRHDWSLQRRSARVVALECIRSGIPFDGVTREAMRRVH